MSSRANFAVRRLPVWAVYVRLLRIARPSPRVLTAIFLLTILNAFIAVAMPWPLQFLVDHVFGAKQMPASVAALLDASHITAKTQLIMLLPLIALLLHLVNGLIGVAKTQLEVAAGQGSVYQLRSRLLDHYQRLSLKDHHAIPLGDQVYRISHDTYCVDQLLLAGLLPLLGSGITLLGMFFVLWRLDHWLAALSLAVLPFLAACVRYYMGPLETESTSVSENEAGVLGFAGQVLGSLPMVKAFVRENYESRRFRIKALKAFRARLRLTVKEAWFAFAAGAVTAVGTTLVLFVGGLHVEAGKLTVGELLVVVAYLAAVYDPLHVISFTLGQIQAAMAGARRVLEVMEITGELGEEAPNVKTLPPVRGNVQFEGVTFGYLPEVPVIEKLSFTALPGSLTAIVGPTGAGKTTLANLLLRFCKPLEGRILIDGTDIQEVSVASLRRQISIVPQEAMLFPVSIGENLRYGKATATDAEIHRASVAAHAHDFISAMPEGYDTPVAEGSISLSGGERQRLALARAFVKDAPILILDEPTSSLDAATESLILESLEQLTKGRTTIVIAHRLSTIRRADQILFLQAGRIVERGTHQELLQNGGPYARLHHLYINASGMAVKV